MAENVQNRTIVAKEAMILALKSTLGIVTPALEKAGVGRSTYYEWLREDEEFKTRCEECSDIALDFVESKLMQNIQNGSSPDIKLFLTSKGKSRGWAELSKVENRQVDKDGNDVQPVILDWKTAVNASNTANT